MPNLVRCPKCNGGVLIEDVATAGLLNCPLCDEAFMIADLPNSGIPLTYARTTVSSGHAAIEHEEASLFADAPEALALVGEETGLSAESGIGDPTWGGAPQQPVSIQDFSHQPTAPGTVPVGGQTSPAYPDSEELDDDPWSSAATNADAVNAGQAEVVDHGGWLYPGCVEFADDTEFADNSATAADHAPWGEASTTHTPGLGMRTGVARVTRREAWCYPGCEASDDAVATVETEDDLAPFDDQVATDADWEVESADTFDNSGESGEFTIAAPGGSIADDMGFGALGGAATSTRGPALKVGKRRKKNEVNPIFLFAGIALGGVLGLSAGYLILVAIRGAELDFLGIFYK